MAEGHGTQKHPNLLASSGRTSSAPTFLGLPPEIRQHIYRYILRTQEGELMPLRLMEQSLVPVGDSSHSPSSYGAAESSYKHNIQLLLTCRQVYLEARSTFASGFRLEGCSDWPTSVSKWASRVPELLRCNLNSLSFVSTRDALLKNLSLPFTQHFPALHWLVFEIMPARRGRLVLPRQKLDEDLTQESVLSCTVTEWLHEVAQHVQNYAKTMSLETFIVTKMEVMYACDGCLLAERRTVCKSMLYATNGRILYYFDDEISDLTAQRILLGQMEQPESRTFEYYIHDGCEGDTADEENI